MEPETVFDYTIRCRSCDTEANLYDIADGGCPVCGRNLTSEKKNLMKVLLTNDVFFDCDDTGKIILPEGVKEQEKRKRADLEYELDAMFDDPDDDFDDIGELEDMDDFDELDEFDDAVEDSCDWEDEDDIALEMEETIDDAIMFRGGNPFDWDTRSDYLDDPFGFGDHDDGDDYDY